jgi:hypothetical protein
MKTKIIILAAAFILPVIGFSQINPLVKYLPDNASLVMSMNLPGMGHKIPGELFRQSFIYREIMKNPNAEMNAFFNDPSSLGLDLSNDIFLVSLTDTSEEYPGTSIHLFGLLKDESLFTSTMKKLSGEKNPLNIYGTNKIIFTQNGRTSLAWNKEVFVFNIVNRHKTFRAEDNNVIVDTIKIDWEKNMEAEEMRFMNMNRNLCFALLTPHPENSFTLNSYFINLLNTAGDIKMWNNGSPNPALNKILSIPGLTNKLQSIAGKNKTAVINFENGKITTRSRNYLGEKMKELYNKYPSKQQNTELVRRLPKGKLLGLVSVSSNGEMAHEFMQQNEMKELMESVKKMIPFDFSGVNAAFKSNILFAAVKTDEISATDSVTQKMKGVQIILAISVADISKFLELKARFSQMIDSLKNTESGGKMFDKFSPAVRYNDSLFVISSSTEAANAFLNNNGSSPVPEWLQSNISHPMVMSINFKELLTLMINKNQGERGMPQMKMLDMFDQIVAYGGDYENGSLNSSMEFRFSNPNENSFKQLFDMMNTMIEESEKVKEKIHNENDENKNFTPPIIMRDEEVKIPPPPPPPPPKKPVKKSKTKN